MSVCSGRSSIATSRLRAPAALLLERDRADAVHPDERGLRRREQDRHDEQDDDDDEERPVGAAHDASRPLVVAAQPSSSRNRSSSSRSRRCIDLRLLLLGVVVVEQVQHAVDDEQRELVVERAARARGLALRDRRAHHDVAEHHRRVGRVGAAIRARGHPTSG